MSSPIDESVYVIGGPDSRYEHWIPDKNITVHFLPIEYQGIVGQSTYGISARRIRFFCEPLDKQAFKMGFRCIWLRGKLHKELQNENPHICERCWHKYYRAIGEDVPQQPPRNPLHEYDSLPIRDVIDVSTGERWTPVLILREKRSTHGAVTNFCPEVAYRITDLKADGHPRRWSGHWIGGVHGRTTVYYDADREDEGKELRTEIAMHRRKLEEAEALLRALYEEKRNGE